MKALLVLLLAAASLLAHGCSAPMRGTGQSGHLLIIGGGLDDDNKPVYERFVALASANGRAPRIVIATAASGDQEASATGKTQSIRAYAPDAEISVIRRETPPEAAAAIIDEATAMFFTGGDQKRIVDAYRPAPPTAASAGESGAKSHADNAAAAAMRRLLARGGVIAGTSAGDAMMSDPMFLTGRSTEALGFRSMRPQPAGDDGADGKSPASPPPLGPQIGPGMGFLPWAITDSHFFERHRFGRLVAALESSGKRLGIGVGEDAAVEVDLAAGELIGLSVADSLVVDAGALQRDQLTRRNVRALVVTQGTRVSLTRLLASSPSGDAPARPQVIEDVPVIEPGQNRQLAAWRFFTRAQAAGGPAQRLVLDGYQQTAWPDGHGGSVVELAPHP